ncbi:MAG TPA: hypothetical protein DIW30_04650 [Bacteroidales bacterium]|nr:hypothetical protein [Bacteroidales bacterium]
MEMSKEQDKYKVTRKKGLWLPSMNSACRFGLHGIILRAEIPNKNMKNKECSDIVILSREECISGISEVMLNEKNRQTNLEIAQEILQKIEEISKDGDVEIIFADDIRKYIRILQEEGLSPLIVDSKLQIRLPLYELTLELPPLAKAIYILYIRHREGLYRKQIADFKEEILWLYASCSGRKVDDRTRATIDNLIDFQRKNLDKQMSTINRVFRKSLKEKASHYLPQSKHRGETRQLDFDRVSFHLPNYLEGEEPYHSHSAKSDGVLNMNEFPKIEVRKKQ